jgi:hypothetical protein
LALGGQGHQKAMNLLHRVESIARRKAACRGVETFCEGGVQHLPDRLAAKTLEVEGKDDLGIQGNLRQIREQRAVPNRFRIIVPFRRGAAATARPQQR